MRYQVFICYKETGPNGKRTEDSVLAQGIYNALTRRKYRVFYAPVSLKNLAGANYEAAIFCAIESSLVMLVVGTKKEHLESAWVRSEWSRFLELCDKDETKDRLLIPLYRDLAPGRDLPQEFRDRYLEALDMHNPGYMFDVEDILSKVIKPSPPPPHPGHKKHKQWMIILLIIIFAGIGIWQYFEQSSGGSIDPDVHSATPSPIPAVSTLEPPATPTPKPTSTPTSEPTSTPTPEPTSTPTLEPVISPTEIPIADTWICSVCGIENQKSNDFCTNCGAPNDGMPPVAYAPPY